MIKAHVLTKVEKGHRPASKKHVCAIAQTCNVPISWILSGVESYSPNDIVKVDGLGGRIERARLKAGLSKLALAKKAQLGNTSQNIRRLELSLHSPRHRTVVRIANALNLTFNQLAYGV